MTRCNKKKNVYGFIIKSTISVTLIILMQMGISGYAEGSWTGTWETKWDGGGARMYLIQNGTRVTGTYDFRSGRIRGTVSDNTLEGHWFQDNGSGTIVFTIANNGKSFSGYYNDKKMWWNGIKIIEKSYVWTGTWESKWKDGGARMYLIQDGDRVTGTYDYKNGRIKGTLSGNTLKGHWSQDDGSGTIVFTIVNDGKTFTGYYDDTQWWNGKKID